MREPTTLTGHLAYSTSLSAPRAAAVHRSADGAYLENIYQDVHAHVGRWSATPPEQDNRLRKRHRRLGEAVEAHAAEYGARLCQAIID